MSLLRKSRRSSRRRPEGFSPEVKAIVTARSKGRCELLACTRTATEFHHRAPRGLGGTSLAWVNAASNGLHICQAHHSHIESHRVQAYANGWLVRRNGSRTSADVPVLLPEGWVLLTDHGIKWPTPAPEGGIA
ncbi:hypothetical protein AB0H71_13925 [Nocardia sp. NPDC050697]|uniref:hypothetical protein n=1 Tax=Nocardia sp. NPDC050697 TaxID=3155158 RepID=UPI0034049242